MRKGKSSRDLPEEPGLPKGVVRSRPLSLEPEEPSPPVPLSHAVGEGEEEGRGRRPALPLSLSSPPLPQRGRGGRGERAAEPAEGVARTGANRVTAIEPQQKREGRVNVFIDGKFALGLFEDVAAELGLRVGQQITPERLEEVARAETLRRAKEDAYVLLSYRDRAEKEIADRLARKGYEEDVVAEVVAHLEQAGYLNDASFAERWVASRSGTKGRRALAHELRQKGVAEEDARAALDERLDPDAERASAREAAVRRVGERPGDRSREAQAKLSAFLARRGFGWDVIRPVLAELYGAAAPDESELDGAR